MSPPASARRQPTRASPTDYDLPNDTAYAETCASVALIFWAQRMLNLDLDGKYADVLEQALYNGALSGLSRDGEHYFYENPLESDGTPHALGVAHLPVLHDECRRGWWPRSAAISIRPSEDVLAVHLYGGSRRPSTSAAARSRIKEIEQLPVVGRGQDRRRSGSAGRIHPEAPRPRLGARRDARASTALPIDVAGNRQTATLPSGGRGRAGDAVELDLPMPVERVYAHPNVRMDIGRTCLKRGPLVYCAEQADNPSVPVERLRLPRDAQGRHASARRSVRRHRHRGRRRPRRRGPTTGTATLYRARPPPKEPATWTAVPYYLWNNRGPGKMLVWIPEN